MGSHQKPVIVLRSNDTCALGAVRSLGMAGHDVTVVGFHYRGNPSWTAHKSVHCAKFLEIANPADDPVSAATQIRELLLSVAEQRGEAPALLATSDTSLGLFDLLGSLEGLATVMRSSRYPASEVDLNDKIVQGLVVKQSGLRTPAFSSLHDLDSRLSDGDLRFPLIVKPKKKGLEQSFYQRHGGRKGIRFRTRDELRASEEVREYGSELIFQSYIENGRKSEVCAYVSRRSADGSLYTMSVQKKYVTPHPFGTAAVVETVNMFELEQEAARLAKYLEWDGVLMVEFKFDERDQEWKCIEVNFRPWLLIDFPRRHGLNFLAHWLSRGGEVQSRRLDSGYSHVSLEYLRKALIERGVKFGLEPVIEVLESQAGIVSIEEWDPDDLELSKQHLRFYGGDEWIGGLGGSRAIWKSSS